MKIYIPGGASQTHPELSPEQADQIVKEVSQAASEIWDIIARIAEKAYKCSRWACNNRPRLVHLAIRSKKARVRKKNAARIIREFYKEARP